MMTDAQKAGVHIGITDSYRPYAEQVDLARRKGLYSQGGLAAKPGTSEHGWGMAADLDLNAKATSWMKQHGADYGFVNNVSREPWHWAYKPATS
jgi:LAS superfamily LD-carboxypeptidase LdcB